MRARIAEGDRAAANRIQAAEAEALEVMAAAQEQADKILAEAHQQAADARDEARREAREIVGRGERGVARTSCATAPSCRGNLRDLSDSLRSNAELLLRDIRLAHAEMTARLDQGGAPANGGRDVGRDRRPRRARVPPGPRAGRPSRRRREGRDAAPRSRGRGARRRARSRSRRRPCAGRRGPRSPGRRRRPRRGAPSSCAPLTRRSSAIASALETG